MDTISRHLRILWRAERLVAEIRLADALRRAGLVAAALAVAAAGFVMLNVAAFLFLHPLIGGALAALVVAGADLVMAAFALALAGRRRPARQLELAIELRSAALAAARGDARWPGEAAAGLQRLVGHPFEAGIPVLASLLWSALLRARARRTS